MPDDPTPGHDPDLGNAYDPPRSLIGEPFQVRLLAAMRGDGLFYVIGCFAWPAGSLEGGPRGLVFTADATEGEQDRAFRRVASVPQMSVALMGLLQSSLWEVITPEQHRIETTDAQAAAREGLRAAGFELHPDYIPTSTGDQV